ncbi:cathepsin D, isoform CRA_a [Rattus norvegicus]|uniref:Cathepsin D, isoform CRA_a n=1 Tax=Rattus norvegicus TaxID=10116 RepID=A6HY43_RAT|nr:cathepsin D, isoform CRA_a [Rattus norvegicus]
MAPSSTAPLSLAWQRPEGEQKEQEDRSKTI